jgi:hypothetical protein
VLQCYDSDPQESDGGGVANGVEQAAPRRIQWGSLDAGYVGDRGHVIDIDSVLQAEESAGDQRAGESHAAVP